MNNLSIEFITSIADIAVYKKNSDTYNCAEICVVGRSNVGKSSFINMVAGRKIAKTSSTPGRTRLINVFSVSNNSAILIDLPGYGYAEASKADKEKWGALIESYLTTSEKLKHVFVLVDSRHEPTVLDRQMIKFLYHYGLAFTVVATKCDKLSKAEIARNVQTIATAFTLGRDNIIPVSAQNNFNLDKISAKILEVI